MSNECIHVMVNATLKEIIVDKKIPFELMHTVTCSDCHGEGNYRSIHYRKMISCPVCQGRGTVEEKKKHEMKLTPGYMDSSGIDSDTLSYQINLIQGKTIAVKVNIEPNPLFTPMGKDLICYVPIDDFKPGVKRRLSFPTLENPFRVEEIILGQYDEYTTKGGGGYLNDDPERGDIVYRLVRQKDSTEAPRRPNKPETTSSETQSTISAGKSTRSADVELIKEILPIIDSLENALEAMTLTDDISHRDGLQLILNMHHQALSKYGVEAISPLGGKFNPHMHEAISVDGASKQPKNTITEVIQTGYWYHDKLLRPARVRVSG